MRLLAYFINYVKMFKPGLSSVLSHSEGEFKNEKLQVFRKNQ